MRRGHKATRRGATLLEALASVALLAVGITAALNALSCLADSEQHALQAEDMQRLAIQKYDEIVATGTLTSGESEGDFSDRGETRYIWRALRQPTDTQNLDSITIEVDKKGESFAKATQIQGLFCNPASSNGGSQ